MSSFGFSSGELCDVVGFGETGRRAGDHALEIGPRRNAVRETVVVRVEALSVTHTHTSQTLMVMWSKSETKDNLCALWES